MEAILTCHPALSTEWLAGRQFRVNNVCIQAPLRSHDCVSCCIPASVTMLSFIHITPVLNCACTGHSVVRAYFTARQPTAHLAVPGEEKHSFPEYDDQLLEMVTNSSHIASHSIISNPNSLSLSLFLSLSQCYDFFFRLCSRSMSSMVAHTLATSSPCRSSWSCRLVWEEWDLYNDYFLIEFDVLWTCYCCVL